MAAKNTKQVRGKKIAGEELLTSAPKKYPRTQQLVPIVRAYKDALLVLPNAMVVGIEVISEADDLLNDDEATSYISQIANSFKNFPYTFQIYVQPRQQNLQPILSMYMDFEKKWNEKRDVLVNFKNGYTSYLLEAIKIIRDARGKRVPYTVLDPVMKKHCNVDSSNFDGMVGKLPSMINVILNNFDQQVESMFSAALKRAGLDAIFSEENLSQIDEAGRAVLKKIGDNLAALADGLFFRHAVTGNDLSPSAFEMLLGETTSVTGDEFSLVPPQFRQEVIRGAENFVNLTAKVFNLLVSRINEAITDSTEAVERVLNALIDRGVLLESLAVGQNQPIRNVLFIIRRSIGIVPHIKAATESMLEDTYNVLATAREQIMMQWRSFGFKATPASAETIIAASQEIYNKSLTGHITQRSQTELNKQSPGITTALGQAGLNRSES